MTVIYRVMTKDLLQKRIKHYQEGKEANPDRFQEDWSERYR